MDTPKFLGISSKRDSIQVRTLLKCLCFRTGLYSSQDSIRVRLLLATLRYKSSYQKHTLVTLVSVIGSNHQLLTDVIFSDCPSKCEYPGDAKYY